MQATEIEFDNGLCSVGPRQITLRPGVAAGWAIDVDRNLQKITVRAQLLGTWVPLLKWRYPFSQVATVKRIRTDRHVRFRAMGDGTLGGLLKSWLPAPLPRDHRTHRTNIGFRYELIIFLRSQERIKLGAYTARWCPADGHEDALEEF